MTSRGEGPGYQHDPEVKFFQELPPLNYGELHIIASITISNLSFTVNNLKENETDRSSSTNEGSRTRVA